VSLGTVTDRTPNPLDHLLDEHTVVVSEQVLAELDETAAYDDPAGRGAQNVLARRERFEIASVSLDETFPLDDGENAAVTLANDVEATQLLCDEFTQLALVHASLTTARLVTTPTLFVLLARLDVLSGAEAAAMLGDVGEARSWDGNAYVERARATLDRQ
jgi:hypothetical protein